MSEDKNTDGTIIEFLLGSHSYNGNWFMGERPPNLAVHWWRPILREYLAAASPVSDAVERETFLHQLRRLSVERAKNGFKTYDNQPITYWTTAIIGEFGELCNMIKKMKRAENGGHDSGHSYTAKDITPKMIREEIGGTLIYIDLLCSFLNIDIQEAVTETFNEKSIELGFPYLLNPPTPTPTNVQEQDEPPCHICGGKTVLIRGKYPGTDKRNVCPQCTTERLEQIQEISSHNYGRTSKAQIKIHYY